MAILCSNPYQPGPYYWVYDNTWSGTGVTTPYMGITSSTTNTIWCSWIANQYQTASAQVWASWISNSGTPQVAPEQYAAALAQQQRAQQHARIADQAQWQERQERARHYAEVQKSRDAAQEKAMGLLREHLTPMQREALAKHGWFLVQGGRSKKTYRIRTGGCAGNIFELQGDKEVARYCVHAEFDIPNGDQWLAQMLSLRHDEEHIIGRANKTSLAA